MSNPFLFLWRHPRRTGFITLNVIVLIALVAWGTFTANVAQEGIQSLPNVMLGYTGMFLLIVLWIVAWLAWAWLIARKEIQRHH